MNVDQRQGQLNALGTAKLHTLLVKNVVLLIVMKPAVIMELTLAQTVAAARVNVAHQPPPPAPHQAVHHQVVAPAPAVAQAHHQVVLLHQVLEVLNQVSNGVMKIEIVQEQYLASNHLPIGMVTVLLIAIVIYIEQIQELFSVVILVNMLLDGITKPKQNVKAKVVILTAE